MQGSAIREHSSPLAIVTFFGLDNAGAVARAPFGRPGTSCPTREGAYEEGRVPFHIAPKFGVLAIVTFFGLDNAGAVARAPFGGPGTCCPTREGLRRRGVSPFPYCPPTRVILVGRDVLGLPGRPPLPSSARPLLPRSVMSALGRPE